MDLRVSAEPTIDAGRWIARRLRDAVRRRGVATLALSGGSTAPPMISTLAAADVPWREVAIWQVDERVAPNGHPDRNAVQLEQLRGAGCRVRPMPVTSTDLRRAARRYGDGLPHRFDVVHLGVGADGHTASWPPGAPDVWESQRPVELVDTFGGRPRMTLTRRIVNAARCRVVLSTGPSKRPMIERWLLHDRSLPITAVRRTNTWIFLDNDAAPSVPLVASR